MNWRLKRKLFLISLGTIILFLLGFLFYLKFKPIPEACFDGKKNFDEEDIDCGGSCPPCELKKFIPLRQYETKFLIYDNKTFDLLGLVENPNKNLALKKLRYQFYIYDKQGILRATTSIRETILLPEEKRYLFELNKSLPEFEIGNVALIIFKPDKNDWLKFEKKDPIKIQIYNFKKNRENNQWKISFTLYNPLITAYNDIGLVLLFYDQKGDLITVSETNFSLAEEETKELIINLPPLKEEPFAYNYQFQLSILPDQ
ncbi:MAG: hypothetical protein KatS3mg093_182 [Candidatus Parcubacteria bacterium]|nr:MAG: hypothetical protein KatS3mg093_182 [Candidatus Parcubacteria bacterium]